MSSNVYDPVTTTDSTHLADDDWGLSLPPIRYKKYSGTSRFKTLCNEVRKNPRCSLAIFIAVTILLVVLIIIIVAASSSSTARHPTGEEPKWKGTEEGLVFYPVSEKGDIVISFSPSEFRTTTKQPILVWLNNVTEEYNMRHQLGPEYTDCNATYHPEDRICRIPRTDFGEDCQPTFKYGYTGAQPCVFVQLNLPYGKTIKPITPGDPLWEAARFFISNNTDSSHVPVTCRGKTKLDSDLLFPYQDGKTIDVIPGAGMPSYIYRKRNKDLDFLKPAVMVQIVGLQPQHKVHILCTAWGQLYDFDGKLVDHALLQTEFAVYYKI